MIWNRWVSSLALFVVAAVLCGCKTPQTGEIFKCVDDVIRIGDTLNVARVVSGDTAPVEKSMLVGSDGSVNLDLLGPTKAAGISFNEFEKQVQKAYIDKGYFRAPLTIIVKPGERFYSVGGEVNAKGRQLYIGQTTVLRAIASCGDFTEFADRRNVQITRADGRREVMDCKKALRDPKYDRPICPGDHINVPRSL
jgi:protein involved in polysaccharide export with SLBB domain